MLRSKKRKLRGRIRGTKARPRLSVFRSNKFIYAQIVDDESGKTLVAASEKAIDQETKKSRRKVEDPRSDQRSGSGLKNQGTPTKGRGSSARPKVGVGTKTQKAKLVGELLAKKALKAKIRMVVFDRRGFRYHGRVKALAEGARAGGLEF